jgi:four helix bundle protein
MQFEKLEVWKRSARLASNVYKLMNTCKDYGFKDQITRSALSIPSNIADKIAGANFERACAASKR